MANETDLVSALLLALVMTLLGSLAKYAYANRPGEQKRSLRDHVFVSLFAGMMMFFFGLANGWSQAFIILGCGLGGWQGASIIRRINPPGLGSGKDGNDETS
ncbi:hypothetical protein ACFPZP_11865 [Citrobacter bitternis]|uniref:Holin n=1 Tax=Citrobacter bitternis TaxID=1585982 RepID=A0ABW1Q008_9ENTR